MELQLPPSSTFTSGTFVFIVGPSAQEFVVHKYVFTRLSPYFKVLMTGEMTEARNKRARWEDTDVDEFARLCQFAYSGNYGEPDIMGLAASDHSIDFKYPTSLKQLEVWEDQKMNIHALNTMVTNFWIGQKPMGHETIKAFIDSHYSDRSSIVVESYMSDSTIPQTHLDGLLRNVKMYILDDTYDIERLRTLSLQKIHYWLSRLPFRTHFGDFAEVVSYAVERTQERDMLRVLLAHWALCVTPDICDEVEALMRNVPQFVPEYVRVTKDFLK